MVIFALLACLFNQPQPVALVEVVDAEIEITFVEGE